MSRSEVYDARRLLDLHDDSGQLPGTTSTDNAELVAARRRIAELEAELAVHRRAAELLKEGSTPKGGTRRSR